MSNLTEIAHIQSETGFGPFDIKAFLRSADGLEHRAPADYDSAWTLRGSVHRSAPLRLKVFGCASEFHAMSDVSADSVASPPHPVDPEPKPSNQLIGCRGASVGVLAVHPLVFLIAGLIGAVFGAPEPWVMHPAGGNGPVSHGLGGMLNGMHRLLLVHAMSLGVTFLIVTGIGALAGSWVAFLIPTVKPQLAERIRYGIGIAVAIGIAFAFWVLLFTAHTSDNPNSPTKLVYKQTASFKAKSADGKVYTIIEESAFYESTDNSSQTQSWIPSGKKVYFLTDGRDAYLAENGRYLLRNGVELFTDEPAGRRVE